MTEKPIIEQIQAQHAFTAEEQQHLAKNLVARMQEMTSAENELDSIKQDYKARLTRIETDRDTIAQKIRDGFEMRPCEAIVLFNTPSPGRKSYFEPNADRTSTEPGALIREECMSGPDFQRSLPLEEPAPSNETLTNSFDSAQSKDVPPPGYTLVTEGESQEGDLAFSIALNEWQPAAVPGNNVADYQALARPVIEGHTFTKLPLAQKENAALTPFGEALQKAAAGKDLPLVPVKLSKDFTAGKARSQFRKAARKNGWPEAAVDLMDEEALKVIDPSDEPASLQRVLQLLTAHCVEAAQ